jgi:hypothetical protein
MTTSTRQEDRMREGGKLPEVTVDARDEGLRRSRETRRTDAAARAIPFGREMEGRQCT